MKKPSDSTRSDKAISSTGSPTVSTAAVRVAPDDTNSARRINLVSETLFAMASAAILALCIAPLLQIGEYYNLLLVSGIAGLVVTVVYCIVRSPALAFTGFLLLYLCTMALTAIATDNYLLEASGVYTTLGNGIFLVIASYLFTRRVVLGMVAPIIRVIGLFLIIVSVGLLYSILN